MPPSGADYQNYSIRLQKTKRSMMSFILKDYKCTKK